MANKGFKTIPGTIAIPGDLPTFKTKDKVIWTGKSWRAKGTFTPTHGDTTSYTHDPSQGIGRQGNIYANTAQEGFKINSDAGNQHSANFELYGDGRWMSASCFNGIGFEVYQSSGAKHAVYLKKWALVFANRDNGSYRIWGIDTQETNPSSAYRYIRVTNSWSLVDTIRSWGPTWQFQGIILHVYNNGGAGSDASYMEVFNMRVGHKFSTTGGQYRYLPAGKRSYDNRKIITGSVGLTDPFS